MKEPATHFWNDLLVAYLHDPPDKPLDIIKHESRGRKYAELATGSALLAHDTGSGAAKWSDIRASEIERLPLPNAGENYYRAIKIENAILKVSHPLWSSSEKGKSRREVTCPALDEAGVSAAIHACVRDLQDPQARFLAIWRLLPDKLAALHPAYLQLPAETRVPDHTIWNHLDTVAGLYSAYEGNEQLALLSVSLGPVQPFIAASRSVRDLWSGSMLLSYLIFGGMEPILNQLGPTALVFPQLRANPLMDLWLRTKFPQLQDRLPIPEVDLRKAPCLPNRFVAIVPASRAEALATESKEAINRAWQQTADNVHEILAQELGGLDASWDQLWQAQVGTFFEIYTQTLPWTGYEDQKIAELYGAPDFNQAFPHAGKLRQIESSLPQKDRPGYSQDSAGRWQARIDLLGRLLESRKLIRSQPAYAPIGQTAPKCSLFGTYEQMGPSRLADSSRFWEQAHRKVKGWIRLRRNERFSAIALIKRFAPECLRHELGLKQEDLSIPDTASVAAAIWLQEARIHPRQIRKEHADWSGQWLHWPSPRQEGEKAVPAEVWQRIQAAKKKQAPPAYYAVLMLDGDQMGQWLRGEKSPLAQQAYHPKLIEYFRQIQADELLTGPRPVTPALHAAISQALANFALYVVPQVVTKHHGTLIYAGGDDVLALLPTQTALACAQELAQAFQGDPAVNGQAPQGYYRYQNKDLLMMGPSASVSAGLAIVHYQSDLRQALELARQAEKHAKAQGRNALAITAARRSGEHSTVLAEWHELGWMQNWVDMFRPIDRATPLSNGWAYALRDTYHPLVAFGLDIKPAQAEIKRQIGHMEDPSRLFEWFCTQTNLPEALSQALKQEIESAEIEGRRPKMGKLTGEAMAAWFEKYHHTREQRLSRRSQGPKIDALLAETLPEFIILCQTLAFLGRGREE